jgi:RNA polymerase sigma-70 factor (ECF subfamily)
MDERSDEPRRLEAEDGLQVLKVEDEMQDVRAAGRGDVEAFERLYRSHAGRVFALCARMTGDRTMAEELTQDVFVKAWEKLGSFRGESAFGSWLHRLAANVVIDHARSKRGRLRLIHTVEDPDAVAGPIRPGEPGRAVDLERAMARLPQGARAAFALHDIYGFSHEEIAAITGKAEGTSKAQLHRARKLLREALR